MPTQGPSSKFGFCPRGLINSVCYAKNLISSYVLSLSPREGASGGVLLFSWFGEERNGNACCVWVFGARSLNFSGFLAKICHFWQILAIDRCNDDFWKNLSHSPPPFLTCFFAAECESQIVQMSQKTWVWTSKTFWCFYKTNFNFFLQISQKCETLEKMF